MDMARKVYLNPRDIPKGVKVLGIRVKDPLIQFEWPGGPDSEATLYSFRLVYVELTDEEFLTLRGDQARIDDLGRQVGPLVQHTLGASWHRWIEEDRP